MTFEELAEFKKDLKKLLKKYQTLNNDLFTVKAILKNKPEARPTFSYRLNYLGIETCVIKIKKIACRSLKGRGVNSSLRLVYAYFEEEDRIILVELFHKNDKEHEDRERIKKYFR